MELLFGRIWVEEKEEKKNGNGNGNGKEDGNGSGNENAKKNENGREGMKEFTSEVSVEDLPVILDRCKAYPRDRSPPAGLNVNSASMELLAKIPGIDERLAREIVTRRRDLSTKTRRTTAWLVTQGLVDAWHFKRIAPWLTARGFQFRLQIVGYGLPSGWPGTTEPERNGPPRRCHCQHRVLHGDGQGRPQRALVHA